jgi:hypothetical protein
LLRNVAQLMGLRVGHSHKLRLDQDAPFLLDHFLFCGGGKMHYPRTTSGADFSREISYQFIPEDIEEFLRNYERVEEYQRGKDYEARYMDNAGYLWKAVLFTFSRRDEEKSTDDLFVAAEERVYVAYAIRLTEDQQWDLEPFCECPNHKPRPERPGPFCSCCVGCMASEFPNQDNTMAAIRAKAFVAPSA